MTDAVNNQSNKPNALAYGIGGAVAGGIGGTIAKKVVSPKYELKPDTFDPSSNKKDKAVAEALEKDIKGAADNQATVDKVFNNEEATKFVLGKQEKDAKLPEGFEQADIDTAKKAFDDTKATLEKDKTAASENLVNDLKTDNKLVKLLKDGKLTETVQKDGKDVVNDVTTEEQKAVVAQKDSIVGYLKGGELSEDAKKALLGAGLHGDIPAVKKEADGLLETANAPLKDSEIIEKAKASAKKATEKFGDIFKDDEKGVKTVSAEKVKAFFGSAAEGTKEAVETIKSSIETVGKEAIKNSRSAVKWAGGIAAVGALIGTAVAFVKGGKGEAKAAAEGKDDTKAAEEPKPEEAKAEAKPEEEKKEEPKA